MSKKQFKAESKRLLDLMINSIYTNKEIFLRELISNASDAMDKLYYRSLTDKNLNVDRSKLEIKIELDKEKRKIRIKDNGCGMTEQELENWIPLSRKEIKKWFNTSGLKYKELNLKEKLADMSEKEKISLLASNGMLIKRPLLITEDTVLIGFKENEWKEYFEK